MTATAEQTRALDVVTIMHALSVLGEKLKVKQWHAANPQQARILNLAEHVEELAKVTGLDALASTSYVDLNSFLTDRRFEPMIQPFDPSLSLGVVSVLDKLVQWLRGPGQIVDIYTERGEKKGFELPRDGVNIYEVTLSPGSYLLELLTKSDDTLWLFVHEDLSLEGLDMVKLAFDVMSLPRQISGTRYFGASTPQFAGAQVPMLDFSVKPDLDWLLGAEAETERHHYTIDQAGQQLKMRMDETGARVKVATYAVATLRGGSPKPRIFKVDRPFYGWWTQKGLEHLPMAVFFASWDKLGSWTEGSLAHL